MLQLHTEMADSNVAVQLLHPCATRTNFHKNAQKLATLPRADAAGMVSRLEALAQGEGEDGAAIASALALIARQRAEGLIYGAGEEPEPPLQAGT